MDWTQEVKDSGFNSVLADAAQNAAPSASQDVILVSSTKNDAVDNAFNSRVNGNVPAEEEHDSIFSGHKDGMKEAQSVFAEDDLDKRFQDALLGNYMPVSGVPDPFSSQLQLDKEASQNTEALAKSDEAFNNPFHESSPFRGLEGNSKPVTQGASVEFGYQNADAFHALIPCESSDEEEKKFPASDFDQVNLDKWKRSESVEDENADAPAISQQGISSTNPFSLSDAIAEAEKTVVSPSAELVSSSTSHDRTDGTMFGSEFHSEHLPTEAELTSEGGRGEKRSGNVGEENAGVLDASKQEISNRNPFSSSDVNAEADVTKHNPVDESVLSSTSHARHDGTLLSDEFHSEHPLIETEPKNENKMTEINPTSNFGITEDEEPVTLEHDTNTSVSLGDSDVVSALVDSISNAPVSEAKTGSPSHNTESLGNTQSSTDVTNEPPSVAVGDIAFSEYAMENFEPQSTDAGGYHGTNHLLSDTKAFTSEQEPMENGTESARSDNESALLGTNSSDAYLVAQRTEFDEGTSYLNLEATKIEPTKVDVEALDLEEKVSSPSSPQLAGVELEQIATEKDIIDLVSANSPQQIADAEDIIIKREEHVINSEPMTEDVHEQSDKSIRTRDEVMQNPVVSENALENHTNPAQTDAEISLKQDTGEGSADVTPFDAGAKRDDEEIAANHSDDQSQTKEMPMPSVNPALKESKDMELTDSSEADNVFSPGSARSDSDDMLLGTSTTKEHTEIQSTALEELSSNMDVETMRTESHQTDDVLLISGDITDEKLGTSLESNEQSSSRENAENTTSDPMQTDDEVSSLKGGIEEVQPATTQKEEKDSLNQQIDEALSKDSSRTDAEDIVMNQEDGALNNKAMVTKFHNSVEEKILEENPIPSSVDNLHSDIHDPEFSANFEDTESQGAAEELRDSMVKKDDNQIKMVYKLAQFEELQDSSSKSGVNMISAGSPTEDTDAGVEPVHQEVDNDVVEINSTETHLQEAQTYIDEDSSKLNEEVTHTEAQKEVSKPEETVKEDGKTPNAITDKSPIQHREELIHTHAHDSIYSVSSDGANGGKADTDVKDSVASESDDEAKIEEERASLEDFGFKENVEMEQTGSMGKNIVIESEPISADVHDTLLKTNPTKDHSQGPHTDSDEFASKLTVKMMQEEPNEIYDRVPSHDETIDQQHGTLDEGIEMPSENEEEMHSDHAFAEAQATFKRNIDEISAAGKSTDLEGSSLKFEDQDKTKESRQVEDSIFNQEAGVTSNELMISDVEISISNEGLEVPTDNPTNASPTHVQSSDVSATFAAIGSAVAETGSELSSEKRNDNEVESETERMLFEEPGFNESAKMEPMDLSGMSFKLSTESKRSNLDDMLSKMNATAEHLQKPWTDVNALSSNMKGESTVAEPPKMFDQAASLTELVDEENTSPSGEGVEKLVQTVNEESTRTVPTHADADVSFNRDVHGDSEKHALTDEEDISLTKDDQETNNKSLHTDVDDSIAKQDASQLEDKPLHMSAEEAIAQEVPDDIPVETPAELLLVADQGPVSQVTLDVAKIQAAVTDVEDSITILNDDQGTLEETQTNLKNLDFNGGENMVHLESSDVNLKFSTEPASPNIDDFLLRTNTIEKLGSQTDVENFASNLDNEAMGTEAAKIHDQALPPEKERVDEENTSPLEVGVEKLVLRENEEEIQTNPTQSDAQVSFKQDEDSENTVLTDSEDTSLTTDYRDISDNSLQTETVESIAKEETIQMGDEQKHTSAGAPIVKGITYDESVENIDVPSLTHDQDTKFDYTKGQGTIAEVDDSIDKNDDGQEKMETSQTHLEDSIMKQEGRHSMEKTIQAQSEKSIEQVIEDEVPAQYPTDEMHTYIQDSSNMASYDETNDHGRAINVDNPMANQSDDQVQIKEKLEHLEDSDLKQKHMVDTDSEEDITNSSLIVDAIQDNVASSNEEPVVKSKVEEVPTSTLQEDDENIIANEKLKNEYTALSAFELPDFTLKSSSAEAEPSQIDALNPTLEPHSGQEHADLSRTEVLQGNMSEVRINQSQTATRDSDIISAPLQPDVEEGVIQRSTELVALESAHEEDGDTVVVMQDVDKLNSELLKMDVEESSTSEHSSNKLDIEPPAPDVMKHPTHAHEDVFAQEPAVHSDTNAFGEEPGHPIGDIIIPSEGKAEPPGKDAPLSDELFQYPISGEGAAESEKLARNADDTLHLDDNEGVPAITRFDETMDHGRAAERKDSTRKHSDDQLQIQEQRSYLQDPDFKQSLDMVDIDSVEDVKGSIFIVDAVKPNAVAEEPVDKTNVEDMLTPTRNEDDEDLIVSEGVKDEYTAPPPFDLHDFTLKSSSDEAEPSQTDGLSPMLEQNEGQEYVDSSRTEVLKENMSEVEINQSQTSTGDSVIFSTPLQPDVEEAFVQGSSKLVALEPAREDDVAMMQDINKLNIDILNMDVEESGTAENGSSKLGIEPPAPNVAELPSHDHEDNGLSAQKPAVHFNTTAFGEEPVHPIDDIIIPSEDKAETPGKDAPLSDELFKYPIYGEGATESEGTSQNAYDDTFHLDDSEGVPEITSSDEAMDRGRAAEPQDYAANQNDNQMQIEEQLSNLQEPDFKQSLDMVDIGSAEDVKGSSFIVDSIQDNAIPPNPAAEEPVGKSNVEDVLTSTQNEDDEDRIANASVKNEYTTLPSFELPDLTLRSRSPESEPSQTECLNPTLEQHAGQEHTDASRTEVLKENMSEVSINQPPTDTHDTKTIDQPLQHHVEEAMFQRSSVLVASGPAGKDTDDLVMLQDEDKLSSELLMTDVEESRTSKHSFNNLDFELPSPNVEKHLSHDREEQVLSAQKPGVNADAGTFGENPNHIIDDIIIPSQDKVDPPSKDAALSSEFLKDSISDESAAADEGIRRDVDSSFHLDDSEGAHAITSFDDAMSHGTVTAVDDWNASRSDDHLEIEEKRAQLEDSGPKDGMDRVNRNSKQPVNVFDDVQDNITTPKPVPDEPVWKSNVDEVLGDSLNEGDDFTLGETVEEYAALQPQDIFDFTLKSSSDQAHGKPSQTDTLNANFEQQEGQKHAHSSQTEYLNENTAEEKANQPPMDTSDIEIINAPLKSGVEETVVQRSSDLVASEPAREDDAGLVTKQSMDTFNSAPLDMDLEDVSLLKHSSDRIHFGQTPENVDEHLLQAYDPEEKVVSIQESAVHSDAYNFGEDKTHHIDDIIISQNNGELPGIDTDISDEPVEDPIFNEGATETERITLDADSSLQLDDSKDVPAHPSFEEAVDRATVAAVEDFDASRNDDQLQIEEQRAQLEEMDLKHNMDMVDTDSGEVAKVVDDVQNNVTTPTAVTDEPVWTSNVDEVLGDTPNEGDDCIAKENGDEEYAASTPLDITDFTLKSGSDEAHRELSQTDALNPTVKQSADQEHVDSSPTQSLRENAPDVSIDQPQTDTSDSEIFSAPLQHDVEDEIVHRSSELVASKPAREDDGDVIMKQNIDTLNSEPHKTEAEDLSTSKHSSDQLDFEQPLPNNAEQPLYDQEEKVVSAQEPSVHADTNIFGQDQTHNLDDIVIPWQDESESPGNNSAISSELLENLIPEEGAAKCEVMTQNAGDTLHLGGSETVPVASSFEETMDLRRATSVEDFTGNKNGDQLQVEEQQVPLDDLGFKQNMNNMDHTDSVEDPKWSPLLVDAVQDNASSPNVGSEEPIYKPNAIDELIDTLNEKADATIAKENMEDHHAAPLTLDAADFKSGSDGEHSEPSREDTLNPTFEHRASQEHADSSQTETLKENVPTVEKNQPDADNLDSQTSNVPLHPEDEEPVVQHSSELVSSKPTRNDDDDVVMKQSMDTLDSKPFKTDLEDEGTLQHDSDSLNLERPPSNVDEYPSQAHVLEEAAQEPAGHSDVNAFDEKLAHHIDDMIIPRDDKSESLVNDAAFSDELLEDPTSDKGATGSERMTRDAGSQPGHLPDSECLPTHTNATSTDVLFAGKEEIAENTQELFQVNDLGDDDLEDYGVNDGKYDTDHIEKDSKPEMKSHVVKRQLNESTSQPEPDKLPQSLGQSIAPSWSGQIVPEDIPSEGWTTDTDYYEEFRLHSADQGSAVHQQSSKPWQQPANLGQHPSEVAETKHVSETAPSVATEPQNRPQGAEDVKSVTTRMKTLEAERGHVVMTDVSSLLDARSIERPESSAFGTPPEDMPLNYSDVTPPQHTHADPMKETGSLGVYARSSGDIELEKGRVTPETLMADSLEEQQDEFDEGPALEYDETIGDPAWRMCVVGGKEQKIDMNIIEPYTQVLSHGGYMEGDSGQTIIVFTACHLPERSRADYAYVMDNLFLYVLTTLDELVSEEYVLVYLHGGATSASSPTFSWLRRAYQLVDRRFRKTLKGLYLVHPSFWLRTIVTLTRPFISSKFSRKLRYVDGLRELSDLIPMNHVMIPEEVKQVDFQVMIAERKKELNIK